jgi:hypothetical protein
MAMRLLRFGKSDKDREDQDAHTAIIEQTGFGDILVLHGQKGVRYLVFTCVGDLGKSGLELDALGNSKPFSLGKNGISMLKGSNVELVRGSDAACLLEGLSHPELVFLQDRSAATSTRRLRIRDLLKRGAPLLHGGKHGRALLEGIKNRFGDRWIHRNGIIVPGMKMHKEPRLSLPSRLLRRAKVNLRLLKRWNKKRKRDDGRD